jgi:DNA polymerase III subunit delta'
MWRGILGQDEVVAHFRQTLSAGRLASTYLFVGPPGIGKRKFALELAHSLLCTQTAEASLDACGECDSCRMFAAGNHPDVEVVSLPKDKSALPIELFIGDKEHRNQEGLCHRLGRRPFFGRHKVAIVDDADHFSIPSANCLLKTLEEPPASALMILLGTSPSRQLPTIRSRSQVVRFRPLDAQIVADILLQTGVVADHELACRAAELSEGSVEKAVRLVDPELWNFRDQLLRMLQTERLDGVRLARAIQSFVDEAGKEPVKKRERLRTIIDFAVENYRYQLRKHDAAVETAMSALDVSLAALEYIDRNANIALVIQWWCESLSGAASGAAQSLSPLAASR